MGVRYPPGGRVHSGVSLIHFFSMWSLLCFVIFSRKYYSLDYRSNYNKNEWNVFYYFVFLPGATSTRSQADYLIVVRFMILARAQESMNCSLVSCVNEEILHFRFPVFYSLCNIKKSIWDQAKWNCPTQQQLLVLCKCMWTENLSIVICFLSSYFESNSFVRRRSVGTCRWVSFWEAVLWYCMCWYSYLFVSPSSIYYLR